MINDLEGLNIEEIKTAIEFHEKINNGKCNYLNICESYECDVCPIGRQIEDGMDCEEVYNLIRYKDLNEASKELGIDKASIRKIAQGLRYSAKSKVLNKKLTFEWG